MDNSTFECKHTFTLSYISSISVTIFSLIHAFHHASSLYVYTHQTEANIHTFRKQITVLISFHSNFCKHQASINAKVGCVALQTHSEPHIDNRLYKKQLRQKQKYMK